MCLEVTNSKIQIAKKNIICFKYMNEINGKIALSYHQRFRYELGKLYIRLKFPKQVRVGNDLEGDGFHSFQFVNPVKNRILSNRAVVCVIPKGSKYILGRQGMIKQYFSEKIIIKKVLTKELFNKMKNDKRATKRKTANK